MRGLQKIYLFSVIRFYKLNNTGARMLDFTYHMTSNLFVVAFFVC